LRGGTASSPTPRATPEGNRSGNNTAQPDAEAAHVVPDQGEVIMRDTTTAPDAITTTVGSGHIPPGPAEPRRREQPSVSPDMAAPRLLLTVAEAAQTLGIGRSLLYELLAAGRIESIRVGRLRRIPTDALATFIDGQRQNHNGR
jgi:excisionase family DNA binding protein